MLGACRETIAARWSRGNDGPPPGASGRTDRPRRAPGAWADERQRHLGATDSMGAHGLLLLQGRRRAPLRFGSDGGPVPASLRRRALRRLVLARAASVLELGLRRLARTATSRRLTWALLLGALVPGVIGTASMLHAADPKLRVVATLPDLF